MVWNQRQEKITHATGRSSAIWVDAARSRTVWHGKMARNGCTQFPFSYWIASSCQYRPPLTDRQLVTLLGVEEREVHRGLQCRALVQAATGFWSFDIVQCAEQISLARQPVNPRLRSIALVSLHSGCFRWKKSRRCPYARSTANGALCGLGGGLLNPDHDNLFFQNHAQMKVYGLPLTMIDGSSVSLNLN